MNQSESKKNKRFVTMTSYAAPLEEGIADDDVDSGISTSISTRMSANDDASSGTSADSANTIDTSSSSSSISTRGLSRYPGPALALAIEYSSDGQTVWLVGYSTALGMSSDADARVPGSAVIAAATVMTLLAAVIWQRREEY
jgi:hypothetical protein